MDLIFFVVDSDGVVIVSDVAVFACVVVFVLLCRFVLFQVKLCRVMSFDD